MEIKKSNIFDPLTEEYQENLNKERKQHRKEKNLKRRNSAQRFEPSDQEDEFSIHVAYNLDGEQKKNKRAVSEGPEDEAISQQKEIKKQRKTYHSHFQGKHREPWHPFDRKSGTGKGRTLPKGGHGKGNWGDLKDELNLPEGKQRFEEVETRGSDKSTPDNKDLSLGANSSLKNKKLSGGLIEEEVDLKLEEKGKTLNEYLEEQENKNIHLKTTNPEEKQQKKGLSLNKLRARADDDLEPQLGFWEDEGILDKRGRGKSMHEQDKNRRELAKRNLQGSKKINLEDKNSFPDLS